MKAEGGHVDAMHALGTWHCNGEHGLAKDDAEVFCWFKRAADLHHVESMAVAENLIANGVGVAGYDAHGLTVIARTAERGSEFAAFLLGSRYAHGLRQDDAQTTYWLCNVIRGNCSVKDVADDGVREAAALLGVVRGRGHGRGSAC